MQTDRKSFAPQFTLEPAVSGFSANGPPDVSGSSQAGTIRASVCDTQLSVGNGTVDGVLYEITPEQMAAMDREEFDQSHDTDGKSRRLTVTVSTEQGPRVAECYTVRDDGAWRAPSERYLGFIIRGLEAAGHSRDAIERVRRAARRDED